MPLLDHFRPPLEMQRPWEGFHSAWATSIAGKLNEDLLPAEFVAIPQVTVGGQVEVDVAAFEESSIPSDTTNGRVATALWAPPQPTLAGPVDLEPQDVYEVRVIQELGGAKLRAAIELVSPGNKDRPGNLEAFVRKCAGYLQRGVTVAMIDIVTKRSANFHAELVESLNLPVEFAWRSSSGLYAVSYRVVPAKHKALLEVWAEVLDVGKTLPTLPLWLNAELCVPLGLEESYRTTCSLLRIAQS